MADKFFDALDVEIREQLRKTETIKKGTAARKRASTPFATAADRANWQEQQPIFEAEIYKSIATVALFAKQECDGCGSVHSMFLQYMERQIEYERPQNKRLKRVTKPAPGLPRETLIQKTTTHICADCCTDHGFSIEDNLIIIRDNIAPSQTYSQDDINGLAA